MIHTSWPAPWSCSAMKRPTLPPPAMTTRTSVPSRRLGRQRAVERVDVVRPHRDVQEVALLGHRIRARHERRPEAPDADDPGADLLLELDQRPAGPRVRHRPLDETQLRG